MREAEDEEVEELHKRVDIKGVIGGAGIAIGRDSKGNGGGVGNGGNGGQNGGKGGIHFRDVNNMAEAEDEEVEELHKRVDANNLVEAEDEEVEELHKRVDFKGVIGGAGIAIGPNANGNGGGVGNGGNGGKNGGKGGIHLRDLDERAERAIAEVINRNKDATIVLPGVGVGIGGGKATPGSSPVCGHPSLPQKTAVEMSCDH